MNLYPFEETVKNKDSTKDDIIENIDIGGPSMLRASAKNYENVTLLTSPDDYKMFMDNYDDITLDYRYYLAKKAFQHVTDYDISISNYFSKGEMMYKSYKHVSDLKYGLNPDQKNASLMIDNKTGKMPFKILNGNAGYINILDSINSWNLVNELAPYFGSETVIATSYKHTSPAGVAFGRPLTENELLVYGLNEAPKSRVAQAYILARNCDAKSSFGDFVAISSEVDEETALLIKREVSDGIIAPSYTSKAYEILKKKKGGKFIILQSNPLSTQIIKPGKEIRTLHGVTLIQDKQTISPIDGFYEENIKTVKKFDLNPSYGYNNIKDNLVMANTSLKYTQSNSVALVHNGQVVVASGQQNRVDCTKLSGEKMNALLLRFHPKAINFYRRLPKTFPRQAKVNAVNEFIDNELNEKEKNIYLKSMYKDNEIGLASDAFFPFADNIDVAHKYGVKHIVQTGGSIRDGEVILQANCHKISMLITGNRFFLH